MKKDGAINYFKIELEQYQKSYELQFNHFMGVFYFWIGIVSVPATAGLLTENVSRIKLAQLSFLIAILGYFVSAKMFDIRCSQFRYIALINEARFNLYELVKGILPDNYSLPFPISTNLQRVALTDFGIFMAFIMSVINGLYFGTSLHFFLNKTRIDLMDFLLAFLWSIISFGTYIWMVKKKIKKPKPI